MLRRSLAHFNNGLTLWTFGNFYPSHKMLKEVAHECPSLES